MADFANKTAIAGIGATEFSKNSGRSELRLAVEATLAALADAGIDPSEVDGMSSFTMDNNSEQEIFRAIGLRLVFGIGDDGAFEQHRRRGRLPQHHEKIEEEYAALRVVDWPVLLLVMMEGRLQPLREQFAAEHPGKSLAVIEIGVVARDKDRIAAKAFRVGSDLAVEFSGTKIENIYDYTHAIEGLKIGEPVTIVVIRNNEHVSLKITPASRD